MQIGTDYLFMSLLVFRVGYKAMFKWIFGYIIFRPSTFIQETANFGIIVLIQYLSQKGTRKAVTGELAILNIILTAVMVVD